MSIGFYADFAFSEASSAKRLITVDNAELQKAQAALAKYDAMLMNIPGVVGVGVGMMETGDHLVIHVYLNVPATGGTVPPAIPTQLDGLPVRVIKSGNIRAR
jgi:hypothetical protein